MITNRAQWRIHVPGASIVLLPAVATAQIAAVSVLRYLVTIAAGTRSINSRQDPQRRTAKARVHHNCGGDLPRRRSWGCAARISGCALTLQLTARSLSQSSSSASIPLSAEAGQADQLRAPYPMDPFSVISRRPVYAITQLRAGRYMERNAAVSKAALRTMRFASLGAPRHPTREFERHSCDAHFSQITR